MTILVADLETDGIYPSRIWMVGVVDCETGLYESYVGDDVPLGLLRMAEADILIGHNLRGYDVKHAERLTEGLVKFDQQRIVDTLELARTLFPKLACHKLSAWGDILGVPKLVHKDFDRYSVEMDDYCRQDCYTTKALYDFLIAQL